jgi:hypothetical protein
LLHWSARPSALDLDTLPLALNLVTRRIRGDTVRDPEKWKGLFGGPRIRLNVSTRVPTEVATFFLAVG